MIARRIIYYGWLLACGAVVALALTGIVGCACKDYTDGTTKCFVTTSD